MIEPIGRLVAERRRHLQITQLALAAKLGVPFRTLSRWEREAERIPAAYLPVLQDVLLMDLDSYLPPAQTERRSGRPPQPPRLRGVARPTRDLPPYSCRGTVEEMLRFGGAADHAIRRVIALGHSDADLVRIERTVPHDSPLELLVILQFIAAGFTLERIAPLDIGIRLPILEDYRERYAGHMKRDALVLRQSTRNVVIFPQVWLPVTAQSRLYRVDFLVVYVHLGPLSGKVDRRRLQGQAPGTYAILEIDGNVYHANTANEDARRVHGLGLPWIRRNTAAVLRDGFVETVLRELNDRFRQRIQRGLLLPESDTRTG